MDGTEYATGVAFEHVLSFGVANAFDNLAGNQRHVYVCLGLYLTCKYYLTSGY